MGDRPRIVALFMLAALAVALVAVVVLGRRSGPSSSSSPTSAGTSSSSGSSAASTPSAPTTAPKVIASADLSADEQLMLERLNELRANPPAFVPAWRDLLAANAGKFGCDEPASMLDPIVSAQPRQPLAASQTLTDAARGHGKDMIARDYFDHVNPDGIAANRRVIAAGYPLPVDRPLTANGQAYGSTATSQQTEALHQATTSEPNRVWGPTDWHDAIDGLIIDACVPSRGHRNHLLSVSDLGAIEHEIGIGAITGAGKGTRSDASKLIVVIETAMRADDVRFVTGVVYRDANGNRRYDHGEGVGGAPVAIGEAITTTGPGGGYALPVPANTKGTITAVGTSVGFAVVDQNVKVDFTAR